MRRLVTTALLIGAGISLNASGQENRQKPSEELRPLTEVRQLTRGAVELIPTETAITTTVTLPGPIESMDGKGFTTDEKKAGIFELSFTPGSCRLSVNPIKEGAKTNLNVVVGGNLYTLYFVEKQGTGVFSVEFVSKATKETAAAPKKKQNLLVSPDRLIGLLDKCKSYPLLVGPHPEVVDDLESAPSGIKIDNGDFDVVLKNVYRKDEWDTMVFEIELVNKTEKEIHYNPEGWTARVNDQVYYQSVGDSSGVMPPHSTTAAWFAVTGDQMGGSNDLDVKNPFQIAVQTLDETPKPAEDKPLPSGPDPFYPKKATTQLTPWEKAVANKQAAIAASPSPIPAPTPSAASAPVDVAASTSLHAEK